MSRVKDYKIISTFILSTQVLSSYTYIFLCSLVVTFTYLCRPLPEMPFYDFFTYTSHICKEDFPSEALSCRVHQNCFRAILNELYKGFRAILNTWCYAPISVRVLNRSNGRASTLLMYSNIKDGSTRYETHNLGVASL